MVSLYTANIHSLPELGEWQYRGLNGSLGGGGAGDPPADLLSLITIIGSSMSLVGLIFGFLVHSLFSDVRSLASTALMNLLATLFVAQVLFIVQVEKSPTSSAGVCLGFACSLRFFWLAMFGWIAVLAHHLLTVLTGDKENGASTIPTTPVAIFPSSLAASSWSTSHKRTCSPLALQVLAYSSAAWGIPLFLSLAAVLLYQHGTWSFHYTSHLRKSFRNCWLTSTEPLRWTFDMPVVLLSAFNIYSYCKTAVAIRYVASMQMERKMQKRMRRRRFRQLFLLIKLHALLALICLMEIVSDLVASETLWSVFVVCFSLQGGLVALVYSCNVKVMKFYAEGVLSDWKCYNHRNGSHRHSHDLIGKRQSLAGSKRRPSSSMLLSSSMELLSSQPTPQQI